jgi:riboflavin-specific deaminase-like protein
VFVFSNLATSLDGKIATASRVHFPLGTAEDWRMMKVLRRRSDAILMGASTLRAYRKPCFAWGKAERGPRRREPMNVVVSSALEGVSPRWKFFTDPHLRRLLIVTRPVPAARLRLFERSCEIIRLAPAVKGSSHAPRIIRELGKLGVRRLLVEGGGGVMWDFASADLIDEYYVTLTPRILGGTEAPTLVDGAGFEPKRVVNLKLARCRRVGDELFLVYKKTGRRGP